MAVTSWTLFRIVPVDAKLAALFTIWAAVSTLTAVPILAVFIETVRVSIQTTTR